MRVSIGPVEITYDHGDLVIENYLQIDAALWSAVERAVFAPPPNLTVSQWADANRVLQTQTSRRSGPWSTDYTPYLREVMDDYNNPHARHLVICAGTQLGKTESL